MPTARAASPTLDSKHGNGSKIADQVIKFVPKFLPGDVGRSCSGLSARQAGAVEAVIAAGGSSPIRRRWWHEENPISRRPGATQECFAVRAGTTTWAELIKIIRAAGRRRRSRDRGRLGRHPYMPALCPGRAFFAPNVPAGMFGNHEWKNRTQTVHRKNRRFFFREIRPRKNPFLTGR